MNRARADLDDLVACGHALADSRGLPRAPESALREEIVGVLVRKQFVECALEGIITRKEACDGMLDHLWTFVCHVSGTSLSIGWREDSALGERVEAALFGTGRGGT